MVLLTSWPSKAALEKSPLVYTATKISTDPYMTLDIASMRNLPAGKQANSQFVLNPSYRLQQPIYSRVYSRELGNGKQLWIQLSCVRCQNPPHAGANPMSASHHRLHQSVIVFFGRNKRALFQNAVSDNLKIEFAMPSSENMFYKEIFACIHVHIC